MNLFQINKMNNMNNNFTPEDFQQSYNPYRTVSLLKNKNSTNQIYNSYNRGIVNLRDIIEIDMSNFDASMVKSMGYMFFQCINLEKINFGNINTSSVENM